MRVRTLAAIVAYEPDRDQLVDALLQLQQVPDLEIVLIDNSEGEVACLVTSAVSRALDVRLLCNPVNRGVGAAHNQAVDLARRLGCERLLLLDQDSVIEPVAVQSLQAALDALLASGEPVAAVGPALVDARCGRPMPFVRLGAGVRMRHVQHQGDAFVECDLLISSGSLMQLSVIDQVGLLDEGLFIDYVDVDWGTRARARGLKLFGVPGALMHHLIGDGKVRRFGRWLPLHSPLRQYYLLRNALLLARKPHLDWHWRLHLLTRAVAQFAIYAATCAPRLQRARWMGLGLWHGLIGRGGRLGGARGLGIGAHAPLPSPAPTEHAQQPADHLEDTPIASRT